MKILDIAFKDLIRGYRSAIGLVFMFVVPMLVTGLFYLMFGSSAGEDGFELARTRVVIANLDKDAPRLQAGSRNTPGGIRADTLSELVVEVLQSEDMQDLLDVSIVPDAPSARAAVDNQEAQVAVIIPADFSRQFADQYGHAVIEFYQDPTLTIGPGIVKSILNQFMDGLAGIKIVVDVATDELEEGDYALVGLVIQEYLDAPAMQSEDLSVTFLDVYTPSKPQEAEDDDDPLVRIVGPIMGGMMVFYAFFTGMTSAQSIIREEEERTLPRLFTTPTSQATILSGKFLSVFLTVLVQIVVLLNLSRLIFRIQWGELVSVAIMVVGIVLCASSFGIFVNSFLKDTKQGGLIFGGVLTFTGMIGMMSIFAMNSPGNSAYLDAVSLIAPQGWGIRALLQTMNAQPVSDVLLTFLGMLAWTVVFFTIGVWRFNHRYV